MLTLTTCSRPTSACLIFCLNFFEKPKFLRQILQNRHKLTNFPIRICVFLGFYAICFEITEKIFLGETNVYHR